MDKVYVKDIIKEFNLEIIACEDRVDTSIITSTEINRPGLPLSGFMQHFGEDRIQVLGKAEISYLESLEPEARYNQLKDFFEQSFPCIIIARNLDAFPEIVKLSQEFGIPLLKTSDITSRFVSGLIRFLNVHLASMISMHGVFVEVYGEGILLVGESGIGKSETALELVKRGHRLVADDSVEIRRVSDKTLIGSPPDNIRYLIEIRGLGILDVRHLFGAGSVKTIENINFVIHLESYNKDADYEENNEHFTEILGIPIPSMRIPVKPGKNLAMLVEAAALNNLQKRLY